MFIRRTRTRSIGERYFTFRLVRVNGYVKARVFGEQPS